MNFPARYLQKGNDVSLGDLSRETVFGICLPAHARRTTYHFVRPQPVTQHMHAFLRTHTTFYKNTHSEDSEIQKMGFRI